MTALELRETAIKNYDSKCAEEVIDLIKKTSEDGKCSLELNKPNGDTLCHILRQKIDGIVCSAAHFSDGWHIHISW